jgi:hypothetical protein
MVIAGIKENTSIIGTIVNIAVKRKKNDIFGMTMMITIGNEKAARIMI